MERGAYEIGNSQGDIDPETFRLSMRRWATGVTIVTSRLGEDVHGMTVSSFTSISLEPPLVLISLERNTRTHRMVQLTKIFGVTILSDRQRAISDRFAGREIERQDRFKGLTTFSLVTGVPLLAGGLASFDCRVVSAHEASTHTLFVGDVVAVQIGQAELSPLIYYARDYHRLDADGSML